MTFSSITAWVFPVALAAAACTPTTHYRERAFPVTVTLPDKTVKLTGHVDTTWSESVGFDILHRLYIEADGTTLLEASFGPFEGERQFPGKMGDKPVVATCTAKMDATKAYSAIRCRVKIGESDAGALVFAEGIEGMPAK